MIHPFTYSCVHSLQQHATAWVAVRARARVKVRVRVRVRVRVILGLVSPSRCMLLHNETPAEHRGMAGRFLASGLIYLALENVYN